MGRSACRVWDRAVERPVLWVVLVAAAIRIAVAVALNVLDIWSLAPDASQYLAIAEARAEGRLQEVWGGYGLSLYGTTRAFSGQLSFLFGLFGPYRLVAQMVAVIYGVATAGLTTAVALRLVRRPLALASGLVVALVPSQVLFSSVGLRESLVWALLAAAAVICSRLGPRAGRPSIVIGVAGLAVLFYLLASLRVQTAIVALWCLPLALVAVRGHRPFRIGGAAVLFLVVPLLVGQSPGGVRFLLDATGRLGTIRTYMAMNAESAIAEPVRLIETTVSPAVGTGVVAGGGAEAVLPVTVEKGSLNVLDRVEHLGPGGEQFVINLDGNAVVVHNDLSANLAAIPRGLVAVTLRPVPWEAGIRGKQLAAAFESIIWIPLFVLAGVGAWVRRRDSHLVALPASLVLALTLSSAGTQGNLGTAFRHRGQILFALSILAVAGIQAAMDHRQGGDGQAVHGSSSGR